MLRVDRLSKSPDCELETWRAEGDALCSLITGAAIADRSSLLLAGRTISLARTAYPLLLAPALGQAASHHRAAFVLRWPGVRIDCQPDGITLYTESGSLEAVEASEVGCERDDLAEPGLKPSAGAYPIESEIFKRIDALAFKTYVPASEKSRAGAGAGLTDND